MNRVVPTPKALSDVFAFVDFSNLRHQVLVILRSSWHLSSTLSQCKDIAHPYKESQPLFAGTLNLRLESLSSEHLSRSSTSTRLDRLSFNAVERNPRLTGHSMPENECGTFLSRAANEFVLRGNSRTLRN